MSLIFAFLQAPFGVQCADKNAGRLTYWTTSLSRILLRCPAARWRRPARLVVTNRTSLEPSCDRILPLTTFYVLLFRCVWAVTTTQRQQGIVWSAWSSCALRVSRHTRGSSSPGITPYGRRRRCLQVVWRLLLIKHICSCRKTNQNDTFDRWFAWLKEKLWRFFKKFIKLMIWNSFLFCFQTPPPPRSTGHFLTEACFLWRPQAGATEAFLWDVWSAHLSRLSAPEAQGSQVWRSYSSVLIPQHVWKMLID